MNADADAATDAPTDANEAWVPKPSHVGAASCLLCGKPTQSHCIVVRETEQGFVPGSESSWDVRGPICHSCYSDYDGDAARVTAELQGHRQPVLDEAGLDPATIAEFSAISEVEMTPRRKAFGSAPIRELVDTAEPGDVFRINDDHMWAVLPLTPGFRERFRQDLKLALLRVDGSDSGAGTIVETAHPVRSDYYFGYITGPMEQMDHVKLETMEYMGHSEAAKSFSEQKFESLAGEDG